VQCPLVIAPYRAKFGLDPSSRANLSVMTPEKQNEFDDDPPKPWGKKIDPWNPYYYLANVIYLVQFAGKTNRDKAYRIKIPRII
jgi:hypothetical protein